MKKGLIIILALWLLPSPLAAQPVITQSGRALDANPAVGGSRINQPAAQPPGAAGQYLLTGESRLGRSFQGFVPYTAVDQFHATLGSASFYNFNRDSVGLPLVFSAGGNVPAWTPQPFTESARTVFAAGQASPAAQPAGLTSALLNPFARAAYPLAPGADRAAAPGGLQAISPLRSPVEAPSVALADQLAYRQEMLARRYDWLMPTQTGQARPGEPVGPTPPPEGRGVFGPVDPVSPLFRPSRPGGLDPDALRLGPVQPFARMGEQQPAPDAQLSADELVTLWNRQGISARALPPGQDLFGDLLTLAKELQVEPAAAEPPGPTDRLPPEPAAVEPTVPAEPPAKPGPPGPVQLPVFEPPIRSPELKPPASGAPGDVAAATPLARGLQLPLAGTPQEPLVNLAVRHDSFVSRFPTAANASLGEAEKRMREGRFYDAIDALEKARQDDPANALIWLRMSHAYWAAGESYSAAVYLQQAMRLFASVVTVKTDLAGLLGPRATALLDERMAELQRLAERDDDPILWALLCYLQHATGRDALAARTADRLLAKPGADVQTRALARFVKTGSGPATAPDRP